MSSSDGGARLVLLRHGETEWSRDGRHTGKTDIPLTPRGEKQACALAPAVQELRPEVVFVSPLTRARRTAELAGLTAVEIVPDLHEWDYGQVEGVTTADWRKRHPGWSVWKDGCPGGETLEQVAERADRVLDKVRQVFGVADADEVPTCDVTVALVAHGHLLRVLAARWLRLDPSAGAMLRLEPARLSVLGYEHEWPAVETWNAEIC